MFTARFIVLIVALGAGGVAASSASGIDSKLPEPAGTTATRAVARPPTAAAQSIQPAPAVTASAPLADRVTAQK